MRPLPDCNRDLSALRYLQSGLHDLVMERPSLRWKKYGTNAAHTQDVGLAVLALYRTNLTLAPSLTAYVSGTEKRKVSDTSNESSSMMIDFG